MDKTDKIKNILDNKLTKSVLKPKSKISVFKNLDVFVPTSRPEVHTGRMSIAQFDLHFEQLKGEIEITENVTIPEDLTFRDKFAIAELFNPIITVWGIACVFEPINRDGEIGVYWDYLISTRGDLGQAQSKRTRGCRLEDDHYTTTLNYKKFDTSRVILSTFGKDIHTCNDKNKLEVGFHDTYKLHHNLLNLYWK